MNLSADILSQFQRCKREYALSREYTPNRWHAKTLLETVLRQAILELSNGADVIITSQEACIRINKECAHAGLDSLVDPYTLSRDYCAITRTVLEALSRTTLMSLKPGRTVPLGDLEHCWKIAAFEDDSGLLHRWVLVDKWDEDTKFKHLHSWHCFGDCAAAGVSMVLHAIEIGRQNKGHQHTDWARAYRHPAIANRFRFRKVDGSPLERSWLPVWFAASDKNDPKTWVDLMEADRLSLVHHLILGQPSEAHVVQFHHEVQWEADSMRTVGPWYMAPMSRPACDVPYTCPWQYVCYAPPGIIDVESIGGYTKIAV